MHLTADLARSRYIYAPKQTAPDRILCPTCKVDYINWQSYYLIHPLVLSQVHKPECLYHHGRQPAGEKRLHEIYPPLGAEEGIIRLLVLHPGRGSEDIQCELISTKLGNPCQPEYEALSYASTNPPTVNVIHFCRGLWVVTTGLKASSLPSATWWRQADSVG